MGCAVSYFLPYQKKDWRRAGIDSVEKYKELARQDGLNLRSGDYELIQHVVHFLSDPSYPQLQSNFKASGLEASLQPIADLVRTTSKPKSQPSKNPPSPATSPDHSFIAFSAPQWRWTHDQCVTWIRACLIYYSNYPPHEANAFAVQFHGFGPVLLTMTCEEWFGWLHQDGACICSILLETKYAEGGVPKCVYATHAESKKDKDEARARGREMRRMAFEMLGWKEEDHRPRFREPIQRDETDGAERGSPEDKCTELPRSYGEDSMEQDGKDESSALNFEQLLQSAEETKIEWDEDKCTELLRSDEEDSMEEDGKDESSALNFEQLLQSVEETKIEWDEDNPVHAKIAFRMLGNQFRKKPEIKKQGQIDSKQSKPNPLKDKNDSNDENDSSEETMDSYTPDSTGSNTSGRPQNLKTLMDELKDSEW